MTVAGEDSIVRGEISRKSNALSSDRNKVHRAQNDPGFTVCASGTASIPSRYLTIISSNSERRGFQQTAKRFQYDISATPGPGQYQTVRPLHKQLERTSDSKRGSGGFASRSKRDGSMSGASSAPAPTTYNVTHALGFDRNDRDHHKVSSMFQKPIAERSSSAKTAHPAPNQYDITPGVKQVTKANNVAAQAAFRSQTKRASGPNKHFITPAPGTYNLENGLTRGLGPACLSSFKSTSKRDAFATQKTNIPGPADYRPFEKPTEEPQRQLLPRRHYLAISAPAVPPAADPPFPGPGAYELRDFKEPEKKYMSTAAFVSNTSRWTIDTTVAAQLPGPASYTPYSGPPKQSFNFNFERKWI